MITAYGDAETKRKALQAGAEALFAKPIDFVMLREIDTRVKRAERFKADPGALQAMLSQRVHPVA
jgi:CheY-like chemotaxis protein